MKRFLKNKRCLVIGSSGFVGRQLTSRLRQEGIPFRGIDRKTGIDIANCKSFLRKFGNINTVFHLAAFLRGKKDDEIFFNNVSGTVNVLEFCRHNKAELIYFSSYVYGKPNYLPIDEDHPLVPATAYSRSKIIGEELCRIYSRVFGVKVIVFRPFNIYGPGQGSDFVIPRIINEASNRKDVFLKGADSKRDFVYVDDVIEACLKAMSYEDKSFEIFNIGSGLSITISDVVKMVSRILNKKIKVHFSKSLSEEYVRETIADIRKARRGLGWSPTCSLEDGIASILSKRGKVG